VSTCGEEAPVRVCGGGSCGGGMHMCIEWCVGAVWGCVMNELACVWYIHRHT